METRKLNNCSCLEDMRRMEDHCIDIIFTDPPYALGSKVIIREDGKPDYEKAVDFMDKWDQPDGAFWEEWFCLAFRILKYGGRVIMFGMDRQLMLNKYYACLAGFEEQQSLAWYYISNFPKASDLLKMIDKTAPSTDLAKKYDGYKYSVAPLKQTCETIMVFQKLYKTGSCLHDTLAWEAGDKECLCGALDIDAGRCPVVNEKNPCGSAKVRFRSNQFTQDKIYGEDTDTSPLGRYPAQTFIDSEVAKILDGQSDISISSGCSKILHKCDYDEKDFDLYIYCPKVDNAERNAGCEDIEEKTQFLTSGKGLGNAIRNCPVHNKPIPSGSNYYTCGCKILHEGDGNRKPIKNNHPTVKPISLCHKILQLFKTPNPQVCYDPFAGSGSLLIAAEHLGYQWMGSENKPEFCDIANARIAYYAKQWEKQERIRKSQPSLFPEMDNEINPQLGLFDE